MNALKMTLESLPRDVLVRIADAVGHQRGAGKALREVSKELNAVSNLTLYQLVVRRANLKICLVAHLENLHTLSICLPDWDPGHLATLCSCETVKRLKTLCMTRCNKVNDLGPLAACTALETLILYSCELVEDLGPLAACTALRTLDMSRCEKVKDLAPLAACTALRTLNMSWCKKVKDLAPLAACTALETLDMTMCNLVTSLAPLHETMRSLCIGHTRVAVSSVLARFTGLIRLDAKGCQSGRQSFRLSDVAACKALEHLDVSRCNVSDLRPLEVLHNLRVLDIRGCRRVSNLAPLAECGSLRHLKCDKTHDARELRRCPFLVLENE